MTKQLIKQCFIHQFKNDQTGYAKAINWFSHLKPTSIDEKLWIPCVTAFGEAFENTVYHLGSLTNNATPTKVEVVITDEMIQIKIWDSGPGFDLEKYLEDLPELVPLQAERGRGLWIIKQISDHLSYSQTPNQLNCLTIQKFWPSANEL
ncbi:MAG: ATP-binding protein [Phormidesmis sp.]